jgi:hypothetical protein
LSAIKLDVLKSCQAATLAIAIAILAFASQQALAQKKTFVTGGVYEVTGRPAVSVWVILRKDRRDWKFLTGDDGRYFIGYIEAGRYTLTVERRGRLIYNDAISLPADQNHDIRLR